MREKLQLIIDSDHVSLFPHHTHYIRQELYTLARQNISMKAAFCPIHNTIYVNTHHIISPFDLHAGQPLTEPMPETHCRRLRSSQTERVVYSLCLSQHDSVLVRAAVVEVVGVVRAGGEVRNA